jgi:RNA polymerase sigma-70 factor (ECF subfamily)
MQESVLSRADPRAADFDSLVVPHLEAGFRTALAMLRDPDQARDAVQDAAFKAWRRLGQLHEMGTARAWFLAIVANECRSVRRGRWWSVLRLPDVGSAPQEFPADAIDLGRALAKLGPEDRLALFLHFYLDLPLEEVGAVLGLSMGGAKTRVYRAAKKLRPDLEMS